MGEIILRMQGIQKYFPGVHALDNAQLEVREGEVMALVGENGAGKSTLMKILTGIYQSDGGTIEYFGKEVHISDPRAAQALGICIVHQELNLMQHLSVSENIFIGREPMKGPFVDMAKQNAMTQELFDKLHLDLNPKAIVKTLSVAKQQMVEIAKALSHEHTKLLILDEPSAVLTDTEIDDLFVFIRQLKKTGVGIIYISHRMDELKRITDRITVMRDGQHVATRPAAELEMNDIIRLMVGRELGNQFPPKTNKPGEVLLEVEHLTGQYNNLRDVSFTARRGEIVGLAGLDGSGRTETLETMFGVATRKDGTIKLDGKVCKNLTPRQSIKNHFALLTEERRATGIFGLLSIRENTVISSLGKHKRLGFILSNASMKRDTQWSIDAMHTKTPSQETQIRSLSGGNQQKVIIGRWLLTDPDVLLLDEPTRGIDVGAKYEIYQLIIDLANKGKTVLMVSSEMPELLGVCDRILVMSGGQLAGEVDAKTATQEEIMRLAAKYV